MILGFFVLLQIGVMTMGHLHGADHQIAKLNHDGTAHHVDHAELMAKRKTKNMFPDKSIFHGNMQINEMMFTSPTHRRSSLNSVVNYSYCWPTRQIPSWTCSNKFPNVGKVFLKVTVCPIDENTSGGCTCEVTNGNEICKDCHFCDTQLIDQIPFIDCTNLFPNGFSCGGVDCNGDCLVVPRDLTVIDIVGTIAVVVMVVTVTLIGLCTTTAPHVGWVRQGCIRYKSRLQTEESRKRMIDVCIKTRTLTQSDVQVPDEQITGLNHVSECHDGTLDDESSVGTAPTLTMEDAVCDPCQICLEPFRIGDKASTSDISGCGHEFHYECIIEWLMLHESCPTCRSTFISADGTPRTTTP